MHNQNMMDDNCIRKGFLNFCIVSSKLYELTPSKVSEILSSVEVAL